MAKNKRNILTVFSCAGSAMFFQLSFFVADCLATTSTPHQFYSWKYMRVDWVHYTKRDVSARIL